MLSISVSTISGSIAIVEILASGLYTGTEAEIVVEFLLSKESYSASMY